MRIFQYNVIAQGEPRPMPAACSIRFDKGLELVGFGVSRKCKQDAKEKAEQKMRAYQAEHPGVKVWLEFEPPMRH